MALIRWQRSEAPVWSPFRQLSTLREEIDRLFETPLTALTTMSHQFSSGWLPAIDLYEDQDDLVLKAELPGVNKDDIDISLHGDVLTLSGERMDSHQDAEVFRSERFLGKFQRTLTLPVMVDAARVQASYKAGILTVTLPKAEQAKPKQIQING